MRRHVIGDTGPLVAYLNDRDPYHSWVSSYFVEIQPPLLTCEAVLSEASFLLKGVKGGGETIMELIHRGLLTVPYHIEEDAVAIKRLLARYSNLPMSLADACLVRMAEQHPEGVVFTLDRDFKIYRKHGRHVIPTLMPQEM
jgi:predicted nucleic acid-binding protein